MQRKGSILPHAAFHKAFTAEDEVSDNGFGNYGHVFHLENKGENFLMSMCSQLQKSMCFFP